MVPGLHLSEDEYVETVLEVAGRDPSIARVLREICTLDPAVRAGALELVGAHLRAHAAAADVLPCVEALRRDAIAGRIAARLGPGERGEPGAPPG